MWFRGLVAVTCIAVLAAIGFYFWQQNQREQAAAIAQEAATQARETAARNASLRAECLDLAEVYVRARYSGQETQEEYDAVLNCAGIISPEEITAIGERLLPR